MKLTISEGYDPNYLATVTTIPKIYDHPNADRLSLIDLFGSTIVVGKDSYKEGDVVVYFPVECCISGDFLSYFNLYDRPELNLDPSIKGYFSSRGNRVKAVSLRGIPSQGFLMTRLSLAEFFKTSENAFNVGDSFDMVGDHQLVTKYIPPTKNQSLGEVKPKVEIPAWVNVMMGKLPPFIRKCIYPPIKFYFLRYGKSSIKEQIAEGHFNFHYKTENLGRNIFNIKPHDEITITTKCHGTSAQFGNILCKRKLNLLDKLLSYLGFPVDIYEYKFVYSSRGVLKNRRDGKFTDDVWGHHAAQLSMMNIPEGFTLYGEIVGYSSPNRCIQKNYDYGCSGGESEFLVYRIKVNDEVVPLLPGDSRELSFKEIVDFCELHGLNHVPVLYWGKASDKYPQIRDDENWGNTYMKHLNDEYLDKECNICKNKVISEGIVLKNDSSSGKMVYKFKSPLFLIGESKERDLVDYSNDEDQ